MKEGIYLTPWINYEEWIFVYKGLDVYSDRGDFLQYPCVKNSIKIMESWSMRGNIPPSVESTLNIIRILYYINSKIYVNGNSIRLTLSSIIIRFVNEVIEPYQQNSYALPISQLAHKIGISKMIVDVRHDATHDKLPSTDILIICAKECLDWIIKNYWEPQTEWEITFQKSTNEFYQDFLDVVLKKDYDLLNKPSVFEVAKKSISKIEQILPGIGSDISLQRIFCLELFKFSLDKKITSNSEYSRFEETPNISFIKAFISYYSESIIAFIEIINSVYFNSLTEVQRTNYFNILQNVIGSDLNESLQKKIKKLFALSNSPHIDQASFILNNIFNVPQTEKKKNTINDWGYCSGFNPSFGNNWKNMFLQSSNISKIN